MDERIVRQRIANGEYPAVISPDQREGLVLALCGSYTESPEGGGTAYEFALGDSGRKVLAWVNGDHHDCGCAKFRLARKKRFPCEQIWAVKYIQQPPLHAPVDPSAPLPKPAPDTQMARPLTPAHALFPNLSDFLTERSDAYEECLKFAYPRVPGMLRAAVGLVIDPVPQKPRGRRRCERRDGLTIALIGVERGLSLRKARGAEVERLAAILDAKAAPEALEGGQ